MDDLSGSTQPAPSPANWRGAARGVLIAAAGGLVGAALVTAHPAGTPASAAAPREAVPAPQTDVLREQAIAKAEKAVVRVTNVGTGLGSGVTLRSDGYVVTNYHVVSGASKLTVTLADGRTLNAQLVGTDPVDDIAVVKISASKLPTLSMGNSGGLKIGQSVLAIGNPLGIGTTATEGIVSALNRTVDEGQNGPRTAGSILNAIQTSAAINPGNSGGALIDLAGQMVGIPTLTAVDPEFNAPAAGVGFAIPSSTVQNISGQIMKYGHVVHSGRPYLGLSLVEVTPQMAQQNNLPVSSGVGIDSVTPNGPAAKSGLKSGDIIVAIDSTEVATYGDLLQALAKYKPNQTVTLHVVTENNQRHSYKVKLGEFPIPSQK
ncbi:MAG TPA: trypsin-like peptidase domain-containing protein [Chloroflexota bacterium]|nr:trypsin-like peptidase domain-containing protein [Chloroflexota bacterium]